MRRDLLWTMRINGREAAQIARLSEREGRPAAAVIRDLIAAAEKTKRAPAPQQDGALSMPSP